MEGDGLKGNTVDFKMDAGPDREPVEITAYLCNAGVPGGSGKDAALVHGGLYHSEIYNSLRLVLYHYNL